MTTVPAVAQGGPEHGRTLRVALDSTGHPTARHTQPARSTPGSCPRPGQRPPVLVYERREQLPDGTWHYLYVGARTQN
ncbi:hypothetical protein GIY23_10565 [Allosaccharopolyspora coralli]|uniref:Uncharacterized protein n=1 Tax=Allosaccharopolyspora coralli TaxID=2665642 RepID=A0A5Q3Q6D7_9PSEU|nr:hypothetical protein [Allosaccharopolyspora coralli]QGK69903.1 hypothetical protein GIY23_10565 [Allosaccharopolyspora coralli]